jgi:hypothetical protein
VECWLNVLCGGFGSVKFKIRWCSVDYAALRLYGVVV